MSSTTQPTTFSDLYTALMNRARVDTSQTMNVSQAKNFINTALFDMHLGNGERFPWAERNGRLLTQASYSTGTVTVATGAVAVTGASTAWNTNNDFGIKNVRAGGKILFEGDSTVYEVSAVSSDTALTLTGMFASDDLTAGGYVYWEDEYDLASDFLKPLDKNKFDGSGEIEIMDRREFRRQFTRVTSTGEIRACAIFDKSFSGSTTPVRRVRFWRPPTDAQWIAYAYVTRNLAVTSAGVEQQQLSSDADEPIVPVYARHLIVLHALANWYRDKKNDDRAVSAMQSYMDGISRLLGDVEVGAQRPRLQPRVGGYQRAAKGPYRGGMRGRRWTTGSAFDEGRE